MTFEGFRHSDETRAKMSAARKGKPHTEAHRKAMSEGAKRSWEVRKRHDRSNRQQSNR